MADQKLTQLTALASLSADDLFYVVDDPAGAALSRKMAASVLDSRFASAAQGALAATAVQPGDLATVAFSGDYGDLVNTPSPGAPVGATYIVQTPDGTLTNEQALSALATGLLKSTTTTGVLSIGVAGTDYATTLATVASLSTTTAHQTFALDNNTLAKFVESDGTTPILQIDEASGHIAVGPAAIIDSIPNTANTWDILLSIAQHFTTMTKDYGVGVAVNIEIDPSANTAETFNAFYADVRTVAANTKNLGNLLGGFYEINHFGSGNVGEIVGFQSYGQNRGSASVNYIAGSYARAANFGSGSVLQMYASYIFSGQNPSGTVAENYGIYIEDQAGVGTVNYSIYSAGSGKVYFGGEVEIDGALNHDGSTIGLNGAVPVVRSTGWAVTNVTSDKVFDANATTLDEISDVLGTLIDYLKLRGDLGA